MQSPYSLNAAGFEGALVGLAGLRAVEWWEDTPLRRRHRGVQ